MSMRYRRGNLSSTPSLLSLASSADISLKEELLPQPTSLADCDDQLETYQILVQGKTTKRVDFIENLKELRSEKEPLLKIKAALQEEISSSNHVINSKSEEVTQLKHKLRHHSEKQIQDNIERLEFQLRNNNYKPREEQKILDEIYVLKRSVKTLKEFELKQRENKKYRSERSRLIDQRNEVFSQIQAIILQEDEIKREIYELKHIIISTKKTIDHLKALRPDLEKAQLEEQRQKEELRLKRQKEKARARKEQYIIRRQERQKRWEEYEASREPFEEEKDLCKMVLAYLNSALPSNPLKSTDTNSKSDVQTNDLDAKQVAQSSIEKPADYSGSFYSKPKYAPPEKPQGKKKKAKAKKEQKAGKVRELSHPPDVLTNLGILSVPIPRTTEDITSCIVLIQRKLQDFDLKSKEKDFDANIENGEESVNATNLSCDTQFFIDNKTNENFLHCNAEMKVFSPEINLNKISNNALPFEVKTSDIINNNNSHITCQVSKTEQDPFKPKLISDPNCSKSYFSIAVPVVSTSQQKEPSLGPTYASVAARIIV